MTPFPPQQPPMMGGDPTAMQQGGPPQPPMGMQQPPMAGQQPPPMPQQPPSQGEEQSEGEYGQNDGQDEATENLVDYALREANLAKRYAGKKKGQEMLDEMGQKVFEGYTNDELSRKNWLQRNEQWIKMATLVKEVKTFPWAGASNVKFPLVATAAMQFAARAYPALVPSDGQVVKVKVIGEDADGSRTERAHRVSRHMSYQLMYRMPNWEEDMDRLCMINPIIGVSFKKTYCREADGVQASELVLPQNLCINYWAKDIESAYRKTEILYYTKNEVLEKIRNDEEYIKECEDCLTTTPTPLVPGSKSKVQPITKMQAPPASDESTPHTFLACHTFWDLDDDGYEEPYVITIHADTHKVVRITARWAQDGVKKDKKGNIQRIAPIEYFTKFGFIPNPESAIYDLGFGILLGEINEPVNTLLNQLIDSGTLSNLQSGFLGKGLRVKMGPNGFRPGEWKVAHATGDEIKNSIVPLPTKEPSMVLYQVLQLLLTSGNQLASIAEIMVGKMPGQNTPASTTQETVEQGMTVFTAIYKRFYRSLYKEIKKLWMLNKIYPSIVDEESSVLNIPLQQDDYNGEQDDIIPGADPTGDSMTAKMSKNQQLMQLAPMGVLDMGKVAERMLKDMEIPNYQELLPQGPPPPDPKAQEAQAKLQAIQAKSQADQQKGQLQAQLLQTKMQMEQQQQEMELMFKQKQADLDVMIAKMEAQVKMQSAQMDLHTDQVKAQSQIQLAQQQHQQSMVQSAQQHAQSLQQGHMDHAVALHQNQAAGEQKLKQGEQGFQQKMKQQKVAQKGMNGGKPKGPSGKSGGTN